MMIRRLILALATGPMIATMAMGAKPPQATGPVAGPAALPAGPLSRIAFGSCATQERPQPIWDAVAGHRPELLLLLGDNIYADTKDMDVMRAKYAKLAAMPGFQAIRKACPILATWDDHDLGANDAGSEYPKKDESQKIFLDFFGDPADSPRRHRPASTTPTGLRPRGEAGPGDPARYPILPQPAR